MVEEKSLDFIHIIEDMKQVPIAVPSDVRPANAHRFLMHIVLLLEKYDTEIDALTHPSTQQCLQNTGLIG